MEPSKRSREGLTPARTPGKNDFKRPAFALGRISFGGDDDSSSSGDGDTSSAEGDEMMSARDARSKTLRPGDSKSRPVAFAAVGAENDSCGLSGGSGGSKQVDRCAASGPGRSSGALADRTLRENERSGAQEARYRQQHQHRSPFSSPIADSASRFDDCPAAAAAAGGGGGGGSADHRRISSSNSWGSPVVAGEDQREDASSAAAAAAAATASADRDGESSDERPAAPQEPEDFEAEADFPEPWDDYGDDFGNCGVLTYSPPPASPPKSPAPYATATASSVAGVFGDSATAFLPPRSGVSSNHGHKSAPTARDSTGGSSAAASPARDGPVLDLSLTSSRPPSPPKNHRSAGGATVAGDRKNKDNHTVDCCDTSDDDEFADCQEVESLGRSVAGACGSGSTPRHSGGGSFGGGDGSRSGGNGDRYSGGSGGRLRGKPTAAGRGFESDSIGGSSSDEDDFCMVVSTKRKHVAGTSRVGRDISSGAGSTGMAAAASAGAGVGSETSAPPGRGGSGGGGQYGGVGGTTGDWEMEAGGLFWKIEANGGSSGAPESDDDSDDDESVMRTFSVPAELYNRMYAHQKIGVRWLWGLHQGDMGGILGDDMGLGKTFQVTCFLAGLFATNQAKSALVLAPKSVMRGWEDELGRWLVKTACPKTEVIVMASEMPAKARRRAIALAAEGGSRGKGAVVITTYGMVSSNPEQFAPAIGGAGRWIERGQSRQHVWDYVILDEGHKIKNASTKTCKAVHSIPTRRRLLLTGTPVQNNLKELHTVVDWATFGRLFGPYPHFKTTYSRPIEYGQDRDASEKAVLRSRARAAELRKMLEPLLLQRTKGEIMDEKATTKTEMVVWVGLSPVQREVYVKYLGGQSVKEILAGTVSSPLGAIQHLKKVCLHPLVSSFPLDEPWMLDPDVSIKSLLEDCSKLSVMLGIVKEACSTGHRVLVFSRFVRMLDIIEKCIGEHRSLGGLGLRLCRIDGGHSDVERQHTIARFNGNEKISVCLVSTAAGGTGITLTGADRVILFDPSWNPADDMQAVDRAYRIGQKRDVIVYRLIAAGTVEEKMYEKQIFKDGLRRTIMGGNVKRKKNVRYFSRAELKQLFTLYPAGACRVLDQLNKMHGPLSGRLEAAEPQAQQDISLNGHLDFLCGLLGCYGASAHGDGLPKIVQQPTPGSEGPAGLFPGGGGPADFTGGAGSGSWHRKNQIDEEEDESEVEDGDDDGYGGARARRQRDALLPGLVGGMSQTEEELIALELDLDDGDDGDDFGGAVSAGPGAGAGGGSTARKGKGPSRARRPILSRALSDTDTSDDDELFAKGKVDVREGAAAAAAAPPTCDLSVAGADASNAIALNSDSDSELEFGSGNGGGGASGGGTRINREDDNDVVELLDDDEDIVDGAGSPQSPLADTHDASRSDSGDVVDEGFCTPGGYSMPPTSPAPASSSPRRHRLHGGDSGRGPASVGCLSPMSAVSGGGGDAGGDLDDFGTPPTRANDTGRDDVSPSPMEEAEDDHGASAAVQAGRERARCWAGEELDISPVASKSSRDGGDSSGGETTETEDESTVARGSRAGANSEKVAAARKRARKFAEEELGIEDGGRRSSSSSSSQEGVDNISGGLSLLATEEREEEEEEDEVFAKRGYHSSDESMEEGPFKEGNDEGCEGWGGTPVGPPCGGRNTLGQQQQQQAVDAPRSLAEGADRSRATPEAASTEGKAENVRPPTFPAGLFNGEAGEGEDGGIFGAWRDGDSASSRSSYETAGSVQRQGGGHGERAKLDDQSLGGHEDFSGGGDGGCADVGTPRGLTGASCHQGIVSERQKEGDTAGSGGNGGREGAGEGAGKDEQQSGMSGRGTATGISPLPSPSPSGHRVATACPAHAKAAEDAGFKCRRCSCVAGAEAAQRAGDLLFEAWDKERSEDLYGAMGICLEAIKLCDEDVELHATISRVGLRMGCLS